MALIPWNDPNLDRILDKAYEDYTDRLLDEAYGDDGRRCRNCSHFCRAWSKDHNNYCEKWDDDEGEYYEITDPEDCCDEWEWNGDEDGPEEEY